MLGSIFPFSLQSVTQFLDLTSKSLHLIFEVDGKGGGRSFGVFLRSISQPCPSYQQRCIDFQLKQINSLDFTIFNVSLQVSQVLQGRSRVQQSCAKQLVQR